MSDELTAQFLTELRRPDLIIRTDHCIFPSAPMIYLETPGPTPRSKPRRICPPIIGEPDQSLPDLLRVLADAMDQARAGA